MKVSIIGNGIAGIMTAGNLRGLEPDEKKLSIDVYTNEPYPYYARIRLPEVVGSEMTIDDLRLYKEEWYQKKSINVHYEHKAVKILKDGHKVIFDNGTEADYDRLVYACGADGLIPKIKNSGIKGIYKLREYEDALAIKSMIGAGAKNAVIIGGGLLGLEMARHMTSIHDMTVIEFFPRLLPRQLDEEAAGMLKEIIENMGIKVRLDSQVIEFVGDKTLEKIILKSGEEIGSDMAVFAAGIKPRIELAKEAGLSVNRGIITNDYLQSSDPDIYAAGDIVEYDGKVWGIIPAAVEHAAIAAHNIINGNSRKYEQTVPKTTLKVVGIDLTSIGKINLSNDEKDLYEVVVKKDTELKIYEKYVLSDGILAGAILFGNKCRVKWVEQNMNKKINLAEI